jgi:hypothetical protein
MRKWRVTSGEWRVANEGFLRGSKRGSWLWIRIFIGVTLMAAAIAPCVEGQTAQKAAMAVAPSETAGNLGSEACAGCHREIFEKYAGTAMARASGAAMEGLLEGELHHAASRVDYRVYAEKGEAWLSFERSGDAELHGKRKLDYFIGSGHRGRTYLFADDGFVFEAPINFYGQKGLAAKGMWDMAPAYEHAREMPLNLPAAASCLACHTSGAQEPMAGTENKYGVSLFAHAGITCERCHGMDTAHGGKEAGGEKDKRHGSEDPPLQLPGIANAVQSGEKHGSKDPPLLIVNPGKLAAGRRDAVCMQCHLEGNAAIEQPGKHLYQFQAGDDLGEFVHYFVLTGDGKDSVRGVSQFEALAQSKCKRAAGEAMTCTSCHDPHSSPSAGEKVAFYRGKCLACHGEAFGAKHHVEQQDCALCHMPRVATADVAHTQASDHRILRVPVMPLQSVGSPYDAGNTPPAEPRLERFPAVATQNTADGDGTKGEVGSGGAADAVATRDLALAWVALAGNSKFAAAQAEQLLPKALEQNPEDATILAAQAYHEQRAGKLEKAREHYEHALKIDSLSLDAASNLAVLEANAGHLERAIALWKAAFARAPGRSALGLNLARALCLSGHGDEAQAAVERVLEFNPDLGAGRSMLRQLRAGEAKCVAK